MEADDPMSRLIAAQERTAVALEQILQVIQMAASTQAFSPQIPQPPPKRAKDTWNSRASKARSALLRLANEMSPRRFPSLKQIAKECGFSVKYVSGSTTHPEMVEFVNVYNTERKKFEESRSIAFHDYEVAEISLQYGDDPTVMEFLREMSSGKTPSEELRARAAKRIMALRGESEDE